jgi:hypothetical protein
MATSYEVHVYRVAGDGISFVLPDPSVPYSSAYIYELAGYTPGANTTAVDISGLISSTYYTYYVYVLSDSKYSLEAKVTVLTNPNTPTLNIPSPTNFWASVTATFGQLPTAGQLFMNTISPGIPTTTTTTGGMAFLESGGLMYFLDTANNRVLIALGEAYNSCNSYTVNSDMWNTCQAIYRGYPLFFIAVLGQADFYSNYPCGHPSNTLPASQCLTHPSGVLIADNKLFIADSGNDRIVIHSILPTYGCYHIDNLTGSPTPNECAPYKVVGKKSLSDVATYITAADGNSALSYPTGMSYLNGTLYIADTNNHRIVGVNNVTDSTLYSCSAVNWKNSMCSWSFVLGQADMFSKTKLADVFNASITYNLPGHTLSDPDFLSRHFAYPTQVFAIGSKLLVGSNENFLATSGLTNLELYSRMMIFELNPFLDNVATCNSLTFLNSVCAANYAIGQESFGRLIELGIGETYMSKNFTLKIASFTPFSTTGLIAVESTTNSVMIWSNYANTNLTDGIPYSSLINNPSGATVAGKILPTLLNLNNIFYTSSDGSLYIEDALLGKIFQIPLTSF